MGETAATATAQHTTQPDGATGETLVLPVDAAAELLGITPQAVRKRIAKGTLAARRVGRAWLVFLERAPDETGATATTKPVAQPVARPNATGTQPQPAQLAALVEPFTAPLVARIEELAREAERERGRADVAEAERDALRVEVARLREAPVARPGGPGAADAPTPTADTVALRWRRWWRRVTAGDR